MAHLRDKNASPVGHGSGRPVSEVVVLTDEEREILRQQAEAPVPEYDPNYPNDFWFSCPCEWCVLDRANCFGKITFSDVEAGAGSHNIKEGRTVMELKELIRQLQVYADVMDRLEASDLVPTDIFNHGNEGCTYDDVVMDVRDLFERWLAAQPAGAPVK
jgi:hypothetical protein